MKRLNLSPIIKTKIDFFGENNTVDKRLIHAIMEYFLNCNTCIAENYLVSLKNYLAYLKNEHYTMDIKQLIAIDIEIFRCLLATDAFSHKTDEELGLMTTMFCEFGKIERNENATQYAIEENKRLGSEICHVI